MAPNHPTGTVRFVTGEVNDAAGWNGRPIVKDELLLSTDMVEPHLRTDFWREATRPYFDTTGHADSGGALEGSIRSRTLGSLLIGPTSFNQQQYRRDRRVILEGGLDHYLLQLFVSGALQGDCEGRTVLVGPGDICAFDLTRTLDSRACAGSTLSILLPRERVDRAANGRSLHGVVLKAGSPVTRLLTDFIVSLSAVSADMEHADALAMEAAIIDLLASGLARQVPDGVADDPLLAPVLRRRILEFIDANLSDPKLGPTLLMRRFRVSRAHLYRMFAADGGVARAVRERRLDAAYRELIRPGGSPRLIYGIARHLGFSSSSQFLRAFRTRFGMTPSEARQQAAALPMLADPRLEQVHARLDDYARQLGVATRK